MLTAKALAPVDIHIGFGLLRQAHQDQFFLQQLLNLQPCPVRRLIDQRGIQHTQFELAQQLLAVADFRAQRMGRDLFAQRFGPTEDQRVAEADLAADMQHVVETVRQWQIAASGFPSLHQLVGVDHESLAIGGQSGASTIAHKQRGIELAFEFLHPGGDRGLGHMQFLGGGHQAAVASDFEKGAGEVDIHGASGARRK